MSLTTSKERETTGLRVCFLEGFNLPQIGYFFRPQSGIPCLSIASELGRADGLVMQLGLMTQGLLKSGEQEARFYLGRDGSISCSYPPPPRNPAPAAQGL